MRKLLALLRRRAAHSMTPAPDSVRGRHARPAGTETTSSASVSAGLPEALADQPAVRSDVPDNVLWARSLHRLGQLNGGLSPDAWLRGVGRMLGQATTTTPDRDPDEPYDPDDDEPWSVVEELHHDGPAPDWREQTMAELSPEALAPGRLCGPEQPHEKPAGTESAGSGHPVYPLLVAEEWERPPGWWLTWPDPPPDPVEHLRVAAHERLANTLERHLVPVRADYAADLDRQDQDAAAYLKRLAADALAYRCGVSLSLAGV